MTKASEKMWRETIQPSKLYPIGGSFYHEKPVEKPAVEYTRTDLADAEYERGWNEAIEAAAKIVANRKSVLEVGDELERRILALTPRRAGGRVT